MNKEVILLVMEFLIRLFALLVIPYACTLIRKYKLESAVRNSVWASEQILAKEDPDGTKRKAFVEKYILNRFTITQRELDVLIEAFVKELNLMQDIEI